VLGNTAIYTFVTVPLSIGLGLALAVALNQRLLGAQPAKSAIISRRISSARLL
jgi:ABC-type sugar transport system permease subunit